MLLVDLVEDPTTVQLISSSVNVLNAHETIAAEVATIAESHRVGRRAIVVASRSAQVRRLQKHRSDAQVGRNVLLKAEKVLLAQ